jgi:Domain of unknown function (DUF4266)
VAASRHSVYLAPQVTTLRDALLLGLAVACAGCAHVPPYARARLAHPTMRLDELATPAEAHVNAVHEGATGGATVASSGCGCN